jgi:hypothetical protein
MDEIDVTALKLKSEYPRCSGVIDMFIFGMDKRRQFQILWPASNAHMNSQLSLRHCALARRTRLEGSVGRDFSRPQGQIEITHCRERRR